MKKFIAIFASLVLLVIVLGACGGSGNNFPKTHEGKYFTIGHPENYKVDASDDGVKLERDKDFAVSVRASKDPSIKEGNLESIKTYMDMMKKQVEESEEGIKLDIAEYKLDGVNGYFMKAIDQKKGEGGIALIVPLDGAVFMAMTDNLIKIGDDMKDMTLAEEIIKSVKFTNKTMFKEPAKEGNTDPANTDTTKPGETSDDMFTFEGISLKVAPGWTPKTDYGILNLTKSALENITIMKIPNVNIADHAQTLKKSFETTEPPIPVTEEKMTIGDKEYLVLIADLSVMKTYNLIGDFGGTAVVITLTSELNDEVKGMIESIVLK